MAADERSGVQGGDAGRSLEGADAPLAECQQVRTKLVGNGERLCARRSGAPVEHRRRTQVRTGLRTGCRPAGPLYQQGGCPAGVCRRAVVAWNADRRCQGRADGTERQPSEFWCADTRHQRTAGPSGTPGIARLLDLALCQRMAASEGTHCVRHDDRPELAAWLHPVSVKVCRAGALPFQGRLSENRK